MCLSLFLISRIKKFQIVHFLNDYLSLKFFRFLPVQFPELFSNYLRGVFCIRLYKAGDYDCCCMNLFGFEISIQTVTQISYAGFSYCKRIYIGCGSSANPPPVNKIVPSFFSSISGMTSCAETKAPATFTLKS